MASPGFLSTDPDTAKRQLWERFPGSYELERRKHHDELIDGETFTHVNIVCPSYGDSEITSRAPTDAAYESELLQISTLTFVTKTGKTAKKTERRVFRLQNGEWSIWNANSDGFVMWKLTDLTLGGNIIEPFSVSPTDLFQYAKLKAAGPWENEKGLNIYLGLEFFMGNSARWRMYHRLDPGEGKGETMVQGDVYYPRPGGSMV